MRETWAAAVTGCAVALLLVGCGTPDEVDGDLTNDWGTPPEPVAFVPSAPVCQAEAYTETAALVDYRPLDCEQPHLVETIHVGAFTGEPAEAEAPPEAGSAAIREAYAECEQHAEEFLGADYRYGRITMGVAKPTEAGWEGGARWFRCDLSEIEGARGVPIEREGSLAGALVADDSELRLGCFTAELGEGGEVRERVGVPCGEPHQAEFVGIWRAPDDEYPSFEDEDSEARVYQGCRETVADYVDVPKDGNLIYRTGVIADWMSESDWSNGDRAFRCYLWLPDRDLTDSLQGAGTEGLPIHTE